LLAETDMRRQIDDHALMVKQKKGAPAIRPMDLHIGPWIAFLGRRASDVARKTGINEGYLSQLISGDKRNPSYDHVKRIADELRIPIDALRHKPPEPHSGERINPWSMLYSLFAGRRPNDSK
jgi:transcriptional regulator with XRE-family HTH domain